MDTLQELIKNNHKAFNRSLPFGNTFSFMRKLTRKYYAWTLVPAFASIAIVLAIVLPREDESVRIYKDYCYELAIISSEMETMTDPNEWEFVNNQIYNITNEPVTLLEQLPNELSPKQKAAILKEYYTTKIKAVNKLKAMLASADIDN